MQLFKSLSFVLLTVFPAISLAEPTSPPMSITQIRPYATTTQGAVPKAYIDVNTTFCGFTVFSINLAEAGGKEIYAAALAAAMAGKQVQLEIKTGTTCVWGMELQSIYVKI